MSDWSERPASPGCSTGPWGSPAVPSAEELMMFADGELDERRAAEVLSFLQSHPAERARLENARLTSDVLVGDLLARADAAGANLIADQVMACAMNEAGFRARARVNHVRRRKPVTAVVVALSATLAAAAGALLFVRAGPWVKRAVQIAAESTKAAPSAGVAAIEVDAVDFGARAGTIFYVKSGDKSPTPVLWVTEDDQAADAGDHQAEDVGVPR